MSSSEGSPSRWSTTGVAAYCRRRDAATQTQLSGDNWSSSNGSGRAIRWRGLMLLKIALPLSSNSKDGRVRG